MAAIPGVLGRRPPWSGPPGWPSACEAAALPARRSGHRAPAESVRRARRSRRRQREIHEVRLLIPVGARALAERDVPVAVTREEDGSREERDRSECPFVRRRGISGGADEEQRRRLD